MNIMVIGSGAREHVLAWKLKQDEDLIKKLFTIPGNAGTAQISISHDIAVDDFHRIALVTIDHNIEMVVVGPEVPLVNGLREFFRKDSRLDTVHFIGPDQAGARLEGSKRFAKDFMRRHHIPTAESIAIVAANLDEGIAFLRERTPPYVLKADGLAAGKGVVISQTLKEAETELRAMLGGKFGEAGTTVVIEEFLDGEEVSFFILTDGNHYKMLPNAKDYKRIGEGHTGANTGGMGAISPVPFVNDAFSKKVEERIIKPTVIGLQAEGVVYKGFLYFGLMNVDGNPFLIEYNCRMGDPEAAVVIPRIKSSLTDLFEGVSIGDLHKRDMVIDERAAATVVLASKGYPETYETGKAITGFDKLPPEALVFHAGTKLERETHQVLTSGGRVLAVGAFGTNVAEALEHAYSYIPQIHFEGKYFRRDIGS
ncbi:MAG: phosphoribosylamine--glycine ligase [Tannerellaceae bacterium]|jgi:phosphoribosylamine--glycine ligase|nr:phosphoribosylamine--glycine ligase [Tannerellaceae bacterium]